MVSKVVLRVEIGRGLLGSLLLSLNGDVTGVLQLQVLLRLGVGIRLLLTVGGGLLLGLLRSVGVWLLLSIRVRLLRSLLRSIRVRLSIGIRLLGLGILVLLGLGVLRIHGLVLLRVGLLVGGHVVVAAAASSVGVSVSSIAVHELG